MDGDIVQDAQGLIMNVLNPHLCTGSVDVDIGLRPTDKKELCERRELGEKSCARNDDWEFGRELS